MNRLMIVLLLISVGGCASATNQRVYSADGVEAVRIACLGDYSQSACFRNADELCPMGYKLLDNNPSQGYGREHSITVRCN